MAEQSQDRKTGAVALSVRRFADGEYLLTVSDVTVAQPRGVRQAARR
jgi:hypothetical protein